MNDFLNFLVAHKAQVALVLVAVSHLCTTILEVVPNNKIPAWLNVLLSWPSSVAPAGSAGFMGRFSPPYLHVPGVKSSTAMLTILIFIPVFTFAIAMTSCATMKAAGTDLASCALDNLPSAVTSVLSKVAMAVDSADSESALESLGVTYGFDVIACAVEKIVSDAYAASKVQSRGALMGDRLFKIRKAQHWLSVHHPVKK